jgi:UDP:flavonoid glycosyltransferase YjiC (YdhE family)
MGHFHVMVPLARALTAAGHEVAFATAATFGPYVRRVGFESLPAGLTSAEALAAFGIGQPMVVGRATALLQDMLPLLPRWQPQLLIHDELEMAGPIAGALTGIPTINHGLGVGLALYKTDSLWRAYGLEPPPFSGMYRTLYLDILPPSLATEHARGLQTRQLLQPTAFDDPGDQPDPTWITGLGSRPTVYVTLGTVFNNAPDVFSAILTGLQEEALELIVTLGPSGDPALYGPQPAHIHLERYLPQSRVLARCDVVVSHAGLGTMLGAIRHNVPVVALPQGVPSQDRIANACVAAGCAIRLNPPEVTPERVRQAVRVLLEEPAYRRNAGLLRKEIDGMPPPEDVVTVIEDVATRSKSPEPNM